MVKQSYRENSLGMYREMGKIHVNMYRTSLGGNIEMQRYIQRHNPSQTSTGTMVIFVKFIIINQTKRKEKRTGSKSAIKIQPSKKKKLNTNSA